MLVRYRGDAQEVDIDAGTTVAQLRSAIDAAFRIDLETLKVLVAGKSITPTTPADALVAELAPAALKDGAKAILMGTPRAELEDMRGAQGAFGKEAARREEATRTLAARAGKLAPTRNTPLEYTFDKIEVLPYGDTEGAMRYLERIRDDKAVQALMKKHKLKVGFLGELDPFSNTDTEKRRLGVNENRGQAIRLRIRTDWYEGFVSYNEILMVLAHELTHNTFGDHDEKFWNLCKIYEKEIKELNPWKGRGNRLDGL